MMLWGTKITKPFLLLQKMAVGQTHFSYDGQYSPGVRNGDEYYILSNLKQIALYNSSWQNWKQNTIT